MLFADMSSFLAQPIIIFAIISAGILHLGKKFVTGNDELKSAAKDVATKKAVGFLRRFFK